MNRGVSALSATIKLPECAEVKGRKIAHSKGWGYHVLRLKWLEMAIEEANKSIPSKNAGAAFVGYREKQKALR